MKLSHKSLLLRAYLVYLVFLAAAALIGSRLFMLQIRHHHEYLARAASQQQHTSIIEPERGQILLVDKNGSTQPIATNKNFPFLYIVPKEIREPEKVALALAELLNIPRDVIFTRASKEGDPYELIARRLSDQTVKAIKSLKLEGTYIDVERLRFYPLNGIAADTVGFVKKTDDGNLKGEYGVEAAYDKFLRGRPGVELNIRDASGNTFLQFQNSLPEPGASLIMTIDPNVQFRAEELLTESAKKWDARSGTLIAVNAKNGAILALANWPTFDPNYFSKEKDLRVFMNEAVSSRFEPGSVFKPITMAAALEEKAITPDTLYNDTGEVVIGNYVIRNSDLKAHGRVNMTKVLQESYNTGAVFAANAIGYEKFREYLTHVFLLEDPTGIDLPGEIRGDLSGLWPPNGRPINFATASFGQGIAVTPIKLIEVFAAFANGGIRIRPHIISSIKYPDGRIESVNDSKSVKAKFLSEATIRDLTKMMIAVIEGGTGRRARIRGYTVAGKTGTAQIPSPSGGYSDEVIHTFVAFTPYTDPPFVILAKLERPRGVRFAEGSVVPVVRDLLEFMLQYYSIIPDRPEEVE
jgi:cell division protein FtsI/penicillin-binding protein 2